MFQSIGELPDYTQGINKALTENAAKPKTGMFGSGKFGLKEALAFGLAGLVSRRNPVPLQMLMGAMQQKQQTEAEEEKYQQHRTDQFDDWTRQQTWKLDHPEAVSNDTVNDYNFRVSTLGKEAADEWLRNPPQFMNVPGVGLVQVPRSTSLGGGGGASSPPQQAVDYLKSNPNLKSDFDRKYGPGAADRILGNGGPTPSASGGFPGGPF